MTGAQVDTEQHIKETARRLFFQKGHLNAKTQEIADEAGVNRALIHYYFRNRDRLFDQVLQEAMSEMIEKISNIFKSDNSLKNKISSFLDVFIARSFDYPYLENFIVTEIAQSPEKAKYFHTAERENLRKIMETEVNAAVAKGEIAKITIDHFMVNLMSLCSYPLVAKPIIQTVFTMDDKAYKKFLLERKKVIYRLLFNEEPES